MISSLPGVFTLHVGNSPSMHTVLCTPFYLLGTTKKNNHIIIVAMKREFITQEEQSYIGNINKLKRTQPYPLFCQSQVNEDVVLCSFKCTAYRSSVVFYFNQFYLFLRKEKWLTCCLSDSVCLKVDMKFQNFCSISLSGPEQGTSPLDHRGFDLDVRMSPLLLFSILSLGNWRQKYGLLCQNIMVCIMLWPGK